MAGGWRVPGSAPPLFVAGSAPLLHAEEQAFEQMLADWRDQQAARNLHPDTTRDRLLAVRRFQRFTNDWPWAWRPGDVEEFTAELHGAGRSRSTIRSYQGALRRVCDYLADPRYQWTAAWQRLFGTHPTQVCFEWNTAVHAGDYEGPAATARADPARAAAVVRLRRRPGRGRPHIRAQGLAHHDARRRGADGHLRLRPAPA